MNNSQTSTPRKLYPFLVGINDYPPGTSPLQGCVEDIKGFQTYLQHRVANQNGFELQTPHVLLNHQATRAAVISGFTDYLSQAQANDVALFYYAGHGSQKRWSQALADKALVDNALAHHEPDGLNETLVCYDSRTDSWDLLDRELAFLIAQLTHNPHFVAILDCCHSGHQLRGLHDGDNDNHFAIGDNRNLEEDQRKRPLFTYLAPPSILRAATQSEVLPQWISPNRRHILLAACRDRELAQEVRLTDSSTGQPVVRGVFSYFLQETLMKAKGSLTYRDLFNEAKSLVVSKVSYQTPQLEALQENINQPFLGGPVVQYPPYYTVRFADNTWVMNGGAIHGIPQPEGEATTTLALFPHNVDVAQPLTVDNAMARASVSEVLPHLSRLELIEGAGLDHNRIYKALVEKLPQPTFAVAYDGDPEPLVFIKAAIHAGPSPYIRLAKRLDKPDFRLVARDNGYHLYRVGESHAPDTPRHRAIAVRDGNPIVAPVEGYSEDSAAEVVRRLEHIARWTLIARLKPLANRQIDESAIELRFWEGDGDADNPKEIADPALRLTYPAPNQEPAFRVNLTNKTDQKLYCALVCLSEDFSITSNIVGDCVELRPKKTAWAHDKAPLYGIVPRPLWEEGVIECTDIFMAIASPHPFDATLLEQEGFPLGNNQTFTTSRCISPVFAIFGELIDWGITRITSTQGEQTALSDGWMLKRVSITFVRPRQ
ncbi:hypothetical protein C7293_04120 [filamentous cyanobacterium CCT1]|nr:hypothetical protein C7293_04120 [filamentous cyanobacterium CCT1]